MSISKWVRLPDGSWLSQTDDKTGFSIEDRIYSWSIDKKHRRLDIDSYQEGVRAALEARSKNLNDSDITWAVINAINYELAKRTGVPQRTLSSFNRGKGSEANAANIEARLGTGALQEGLEPVQSELGALLAVYQFLELLPQDQQIILVHSFGLCGSEELNDVVIADKLGIKRMTVYRKRKAALATLKQILDHYDLTLQDFLPTTMITSRTGRLDRPLELRELPHLPVTVRLTEKARQRMMDLFHPGG